MCVWFCYKKFVFERRLYSAPTTDVLSVIVS